MDGETNRSVFEEFELTASTLTTSAVRDINSGLRSASRPQE